MVRLAWGLLLLSSGAFAHGGGLNAEGCHNDRTMAATTATTARAASLSERRLTSWAAARRQPDPARHTPTVPRRGRQVRPQLERETLVAVGSSTGMVMGWAVSRHGGSLAELLIFALVASSPSSAQEVRQGEVWRYEKDGVVYYTKLKPPEESKGQKLLFSYVEKDQEQVWEMVSSDEESSTFVHRKSISRDREYVTGWMLGSRVQAKKTQYGTVWSVKERWTINCHTLRFYRTDVVMHAGALGSGDVVHSWNGVEPEASIVPDTIGESIADRMCAKPKPKPNPP